MGVLALVDVDTPMARQVDALGDVRSCRAGPEMEQVLAPIRESVDLVLIGPSVNEPVQVVQRAHRLGRDIGVLVLLQEQEQYARVEAALRLAPFVGTDVACVDLSNADLPELVRAAAARTRSRRGQRALYANLNARLSAPPPRPAPPAEVAAAALLDFAPVGIVALDPSRRIVSVNREASRILGASERDLLGRDLTRLARHGDPAWLHRATPHHGEPPIVAFPGPDGHDRIVEVRSAAHALQSEQTFVALTDVTTRVRAEALREAARRDAEDARRALETTLRSIGDAVIATDTSGRLTMMNPVAEALTGWRENEARERYLDEVFHLLHEETRTPVESPVAEVLRGGGALGLANHAVLVARDGTEHPVDDTAAPIRDTDGNVHGVVVVFRSVSAEKRTELRRAVVAEASEVLSATFDYREALRSLATILVPRFADWCVLDLAGPTDDATELVAVAHRDEKMAELGREMRGTHPPPPGDPFSVTGVLRTGESVFLPLVGRALLAEAGVHEARIRRLELLGLRSAIIVPLVGREGVLGAITVAHAESGRVYSEEDRAFLEDFGRRVGVVIDNARLFAAEQRAREEADAANRAKDEFVATVSHELRTPLNAVLGWARMLAMRTLGEERQGAALDAIERNAIAMAQLIDDLLDVSRIVSGKLRLDPELVDPVRVVEAALDTVRPAAAAKGIEIRTAFETDASIVADPNRFQQIAWNLLSNAVKFTPKGGRVDVTLRRTASNLVLAVTDTGIGIPPSFVPHLFEPFRQADGTSTRAHGGLGLGLAITRHLVELHGGRIEARSEGAGKGATFSLALPTLAPAPLRRPRELRGTREPTASVPFVSLSGVRVLAVDDDPDARLLITQCLELAGARVVTAESCADAMQKMADDPPDVLLSDLGMPGEDGYALIRMVRALPREQGGAVPAAALTAYTRTEDRKKVLAAGFTLHLTKPLDPSELVTVVATLSRFSHNA